MVGTPISTRQPPERRFENYILTQVVDSSVGLTNIENSKFTQLSGPPDYTGNNIGQGLCDDGYSNPYPIGFDFSIDGITYKQFVANVNGWMVLLDPTTGSFDPHTVLASPFESFLNASILPTFGSNSVLLAPWFDDLRNIANVPSQLINSPYNYSGVKTTRISQGLEPAPPYVNAASYAVSYYVDARSTKGRRLIIRWATSSNYTSPSSVIRFEVVIYENGTIEFRYSPRTTIVTSTVKYEGATIGIFMPGGTNRFRDFAQNLGYRDNDRKGYTYGGFVYDSTYIDSVQPGNEDYPASASYTISLVPYLNWPGLQSEGSVFTFSPPVNRRAVLPRRDVKRRDGTLNLPTVARTGDDRLGNGPSYFDDRFTLPFTSAGSYVPLVDTALDNQSVQVPPISTITSQIWTCAGVTTTSVTIPGDPRTTFNVVLRLRGVLEQKTITGGTLVAGTVSGTTLGMMLGGTPAGDSRNVVSLSISNPSQTYYLNNGTSGAFIVYAVDYTVTIPMLGGSTITLKIDSIDGQELINAASTGGPLSIPSLSTPSQPYAGQFVTMNVLSISTTGVSPNTQGAVNYPTTLPRFFGGSAPGTLERQNLFSGDVLVTGSVVKNAVDPFVGELPVKYTPSFNESRRPDQDPSTLASSFYSVGSSIAGVGAGFDQPLKSKTQIKVQLPVTMPVPLPAGTCSIFYYNQANKAWEIPVNTSYQVAPGAFTPPVGTSGGDSATAQSYLSHAQLPEDFRGFGPAGNIVVSGSHNTDSGGGAAQTDALIWREYTHTKATDYIGRKYPKSIRINDNYAPSANETFTIPITQPFLLEKATFEIPISFGPGWFTDQTQAFTPLGNVEFIINQAIDFGGPALTVALMRHIPLQEEGLSGVTGGSLETTATSIRDLIMTGTITHALDYVSGVALQTFPPSSSVYLLSPVGFLNYANPAGAVVPVPGNLQFTGSVTVQAQCASVAGLDVAYIGNFSDTAPNNAAAAQALLTQPTILLGQSIQTGYTADTLVTPFTSPFGRSGGGFSQAGRAILGNEYATFQNLDDQTGATAPNPFFITSNPNNLPAQIQAVLAAESASLGSFNLNAAAFVSLKSNFPSPYLLLPGDTLVLSISKTRPFTYTETGQAISNSLGGHDVVLTPGNINITLYGSQVANGSEYHDTLNQPLASDVCHELLGAEPVLDQFEPAYRFEYTGSFSDNVMLGNLLTATVVGGQTVFTPGVRDRKLSKLSARTAPPLTSNAADTLINPYYGYRLQPWFERVGNVRTSQFATDSERFWDSMLPSFADCIRANGVGIFIESLAEATVDGFRDMPGVPDGVLKTIGQIWLDFTVNGGGLFDKVSDRCWTHSFPYEPRYSGVTRLLNTSNGFIANFLLDPGVILGPMHPTPVQGLFPLMPKSKVVSSSVVFPGNAVQDISIYYHSADAFVGVTNVNGLVVTSSAPVADVARTLFGFGDNNTLHFLDNNSGFVVPYGSNTTQQGTVHYADFRAYDDFNVDTGSGQFLSPFAFSPIIRGWKYGIYNGLPTFSKGYWRRNRFGQLRDMLEQRLFTKYYESPENDPTDPNFQQGVKDAVVNVKFLSPSGDLTDPQNTWSSNLSFECTSSLPYFDGVLTNRPPVNVATLNKAVLNLNVDGNGNVIV